MLLASFGWSVLEACYYSVRLSRDKDGLVLITAPLAPFDVTINTQLSAAVVFSWAKQISSLSVSPSLSLSLSLLCQYYLSVSSG